MRAMRWSEQLAWPPARRLAVPPTTRAASGPGVPGRGPLETAELYHQPLGRLADRERAAPAAIERWRARPAADPRRPG